MKWPASAQPGLLLSATTYHLQTVGPCRLQSAMRRSLSVKMRRRGGQPSCRHKNLVYE